jgi:hypothetical protein
MCISASINCALSDHCNPRRSAAKGSYRGGQYDCYHLLLALRHIVYFHGNPMEVGLCGRSEKGPDFKRFARPVG